jgi:proton glutamate symport protein
VKRSGLALHWQILIAIAAATLLGLTLRAQAGEAAGRWLAVFDFGGQLFMAALKMLIVPLIASSMIVGVAGLGAHGQLGRIGLRTFLLYAVAGAAAILVGLVLVNVVRPGIVDGLPAGAALALHADSAAVAQAVGDRDGGDILAVFLRMIPENVVASAGNNGDVLALIVFSLLFGFFLTRVTEERARPVLGFWRGVSDVMLLMTEWVMKFAPFGVFCLVARVVIRTGFSAATPLLAFAACVLAGLAIHMFLTMPLLIRMVTGVSPWRIFPSLAPALLTAFSTASSSATVPLTLDCVEKRARVSSRVASFVVPLGATINMNGTALYECAAVLFLAQAYGVPLGVGAQATIVTLALLTSIGVAGIPAASLVAITVILSTLGLPAEGVAVLLVFDRVLDMSRTAVNVFGDACTAVMVARLEGEKHVLEPDGRA